MNKKTSFSLLVIGLFLALGGVSIYRKVVWREPTDGVVWTERAGRVQAARVVANSPADLHGIKQGDVLYSINDLSVATRIDIVKSQW
ncbi:MAG: PDZ domain-containing protein, partial [Acidobacteriota bacterium]